MGYANHDRLVNVVMSLLLLIIIDVIVCFKIEMNKILCK